MVKHAQAIRRQKPTNYLSVFDHFVGLAVKELNTFLTKLLIIFAEMFHRGCLTGS